MKQVHQIPFTSEHGAYILSTFVLLILIHIKFILLLINNSTNKDVNKLNDEKYLFIYLVHQVCTDLLRFV